MLSSEGLEIRPIGRNDMNEIIDMQARVWQDYFLKERNQEVPMMRRSLKNMEYYAGKEPGGCFIGEMDGQIIGSIITHIWGKVGWFGPLEVSPEHQSKGIGKALVSASIEYMKDKGCTTIGCETMASSPKNIAFYMKQGFRAMSLSNVMYKRLGALQPNAEESNPAEGAPLSSGMRDLWSSIQPGLDYSVEIASLDKHGLGELWALPNDSHAIVHTYEMFEDSNNAIVKLLAARPGAADAPGKLLDRCEMSAIMAGKTGMFIRTYDATPPSLDWFFKRGYILQSNSIRLIFRGLDEAGDYFHVSCWSG